MGACYDIKYHNEDYLKCPTNSPTRFPVQSSANSSNASTPPNDDGLGTGSIVGIVVGIIVVLALVIGLVAYMNSRSGTDFDTMNPSIQKMKGAEQGQEASSAGTVQKLILE